MKKQALMSVFAQPVFTPSNAALWLNYTQGGFATAIKDKVNNIFMLSSVTSVANVNQTLRNTAEQFTAENVRLDEQLSMCIYNGYENLMPYSSDADQFNKLTSGTGVIPVATKNYGTAPDGSQTTTRVILDKGAGSLISDFSIFSDSVTITSGLPYTLGFWAKSTDGNTYTVGPIIANHSNSTPFTITPDWQFFTVTRDSTTTGGSNNGVLLRGTFGHSDYADIEIWMDEATEKAGFQLVQGGYIAPFIYTNGAATSTLADLVGIATNTAYIDEAHELSGTTTISLTGTKWAGSGLDPAWANARFLNKTTGLFVGDVVSQTDANEIIATTGAVIDSTSLVDFSRSLLSWSDIETFRDTYSAATYTRLPVNDYTVRIKGKLFDFDDTWVQGATIYFSFVDGDNATAITIQNATTVRFTQLVATVQTNIDVTVPAIARGDEFTIILEKRSSGLSTLTYNSSSNTGTVTADSQIGSVLAYLVPANLGCIDSNISGSISLFGVLDDA